MARKFADRWLYKTLGTGLHGREVLRREIKDPRRKLYDTVLLANLAARGKALPGAKVPFHLAPYTHSLLQSLEDRDASRDDLH